MSGTQSATEPLLELRDLSIQYKVGDSLITAASNVSITIDQGEYFGLVGESGCGKSTILKSIVGGLDENGEVSSGKIIYDGQEIQSFTDEELNEQIRWKEIAFIPQSSMNSLDPLRRIDSQAIEIMQTHVDIEKENALDRLKELFNVVGLQESRISDYPHQFSGGMQQRAIIAFSLLLEPKLLIADEPTTALDVIMQDQVFRYLDEIKEQTNTSLLLVTHDISVVFESCDRLGVMHAGQLAESGPVTEIDANPRHPYSILLQESFPDIRFPDKKLEEIKGSPPQTGSEVNYCTFRERCPWEVEECSQSAPPLEGVRSTDALHQVSCFRKEEVLQDYQSDEMITQEKD